jgi:AraC-like DNA-binding protein
MKPNGLTASYRALQRRVALRPVGGRRSVPDYAISVRLLLPFLRVLQDHPRADPRSLEAIRSLDPEQRVPIAVAHELLAEAIARTNDPDLGLKAGRLVEIGDHGVLDYAVSLASTVADAIACAARYMRLLTDAMDYLLEVDGARAMVHMRNKVQLPRASADFQASATHTVHLLHPAREIPGLEWWFSHPRPPDLTEYERTFSPARLRFSMPSFGYCFDKGYLDERLPRRDSKLHRVIRNHGDTLLAALPPIDTFAEVVRRLIVADLGLRNPTLQRVASLLDTSTRTVARKLESEGVSFSNLLEELRRGLALRYLLSGEMRICDIGFMLGYAQVPPFYRAFRRWTGVTPTEYRRRHYAGEIDQRA